MDYIAVIHKDPDSDFGVSFPDFPGCVTASPTMDEAGPMAQEALEFHIEGMKEDGEPIPQPSALEEILADPDYADALAYVVVSVPDGPERVLRINIEVPETALRRIDALAESYHMSRSAYLVFAGTRLDRKEHNSPGT